jgi:repressor LexA
MQNIYQKKLAGFYKDRNRMPTYTEMTKLFGFKSKNAVARVVGKLVEAGLVAKDHLGRLVPQDGFGGVPMLGFVTAGFPANVEEEMMDRINFDDLLIGKKEMTYLLTVDGDSMIDEHINDGDMVLVEKTENAKDMDIVIAEVDGEFTMKYLRVKGDKKWLEPANKNYKPIHPEYSLKVIAKVKAVIRKY